MAFPDDCRRSLGANREVRSLPTTPFRPDAPLPPSASHFLNQNVFPSISSVSTSQPLHRDSFSAHLRPPQQNNTAYIPHIPQNTAYISQNQQYRQLPPHLSQPHFTPSHLRHPHNHISHNSQPQPLRYPSHSLAPALAPDPFLELSVPYSPTSGKTLPSVAHIPILSGRADYGAWNDGVRTLLLHLGYLGHISDPSTFGSIPLPDRDPTFPPLLSMSSSPSEISAYRSWWEQDNVASHVLLSRLSPIVRSLLPYDDCDPTSPRTSRVIYDTLRETYGLRGYVAGSALYADLRASLCGSRVQEFITKWRSGVSQLRSARYPLIIREVIELFLERLPTSVPFQILRHKVMERIDSIRDDDVTEFIRITNEVLDIDNLYRRSNPPRSTANPASRSSTTTVPRVPPAISPGTPASTTITSSTAVPTPRSKLLCINSNCGLTGHTIDTCFKVGGGLEGQRDLYLAKRKGAQAHLAQFDDLIASRDRTQAFLLHIVL
jgi:hypothetical protein